jgi:4-amino-4-deoxy-L-arabinose transferase-like glycosyltransferase
VNIRNRNLLINSALALILLLGALMRLQAVLQTEVDTPFRADARKYAQYAYNLKYFGTYTYSVEGLQGDPSKLKPDSLATPGYPLFLALLLDRSVSQKSYYRILLTQALLSTLTILMTYLLFASIAGKAAGLLSAALTALSPHLINMNVYVLTETLACFLLLAALLCLARKKTPDTPWLLLLTGILLAAATLTRPWTQGFAAVLAAYLFFSSARVPARRAVLVLVGFCLLFGPWVIRNFLNIDTSSGGSLLVTSIYHGSFPDMMLDNRPETLGFAYRFDPRGGELSASLPALVQYLISKFQGDPWAYAKWYVFGKTAAVFSWSMLGGVGDVFVYPVFKTPFENLWHFRLAHGFMHFIHNGVMGASLLACCLIWLPRRYLLLPEHGVFLARVLGLLIFYFVALNVILAPYSRYSVPLRPVMYGMAVVGVIIVWRLMQPAGRAPADEGMSRPV